MTAQDSMDKDRQYPGFDSLNRNTGFPSGNPHNLKASDSEPVSVIVTKLSSLDSIKAVDMGCGAARYDMVLYRFFHDKLKLTCLDADKELLNNLTTYLSRQGVRNFSSGASAGDTMPFNDDSLDCVLAFNTIQRYDVPMFLSESVRVLKTGSYLFVYTRLREQNQKTGRGQYTLNTLKKSLDAIGNAAVESIVFFAYSRMAAFEQLHFRSPSPNEMPVPFYTADEMKEAVKEFSLNIGEEVFLDQPQVHRFDENVLFIIRKEQKTSIEYLKVAASSSFSAPGMVV
jgi:ubiquinone/menaquinone biosynthesis C-methylase UbiE